MSKLLFMPLIIQHFAEGGDSGTAESGPATQESETEIRYGIQDEETAEDTETDTEEYSNENLESEFEELIKSKYKKQFGNRVKDAVDKRFKSTNETVNKYQALMPVVEMLSQKYGVDASDIDGLSQAIIDDDAYYEEEALERGFTVEQLKAIKKNERITKQLQNEVDERRQKEETDNIYNGWLKESEEVKNLYPNFEFGEELKNTKFANYLQSGLKVRDAYELTHRDEIFSNAMQYTAEKASQKIANSIIANQKRPVENGIKNRSSAIVKNDVNSLSDEDIENVIKQVKRGAKIRF